MNYIAFDTETHLIAPGRVAPPLVCMTWQAPTGESGICLKGGVRERFQSWLDSDALLIGHNIAFDLAVVANAFPEFLPRIFEGYRNNRFADTKVWEQLYDIATGDSYGKKYSLAAVAKRRLDVDVEGKTGPDIWRLRYQELDGVPLKDWPKAATDYALMDAVYTKALWEEGALKEGIPDDFWRQMRAAWCLHLMGMWGVRTDPEAVAALEKELHDHVDDEIDFLCTTPLYRRTPARTNRNGDHVPEKITQNNKETALAVVRAYTGIQKGSPGTEPHSAAGKELLVHLPNNAEAKALVRAVEHAGKLDGLPRTDKGGIGRAEAVLRGSGNKTLLRLADISADKKLLNTYIPLLKQRVINANWNVLVDSGRISCRGPNLTNQPRRAGVRECFVPRGGWWYLFADYHIAELCSLSQVLLNRYGYSEMAEVIRRGRDIHLEVAASLAGCSYEEAVRRKDSGDKQIKQFRQLSKVLDFGVPGGMGAKKFYFHTCKELADNGCSECFGSGIRGGQPTEEPEDNPACGCIPIPGMSYEYIRDSREAWLDRFPEMREYFRDIGEMVEMGGGEALVESVGSGRLRGGVGYTNGCNHFFQALTADGAKAAMWLITEECYDKPDSPLYGCRPVLFIHDEFGLEVPADYSIARPAAKRLEELMVAGMSEFVPDVPVKADAALMRRWYKGAEPVYENGELVLWEP